MMRENVKDFYKYLRKNENVKKELEDNLKKYTFSDMKAEDQEAIILSETEKIAEKYNFNVTKDDLADYLKEAGKALTEEDLLNVSGGVSTAGVAMGFLMLTGISIGSGAAVNIVRSRNAALSAESGPSIVREVEDYNGSSTDSDLEITPTVETSGEEEELSNDGLMQGSTEREREQLSTQMDEGERVKTNVAKPSLWRRFGNFFKNFLGIKNNNALPQEKVNADKEVEKEDKKTEEEEQKMRKAPEEEKKEEKENDKKNEEKNNDNKDGNKNEQEKQKLIKNIKERIEQINSIIEGLDDGGNKDTKDIIEKNIKKLREDKMSNGYELKIDKTTGNVTINNNGNGETVGKINIDGFKKWLQEKEEQKRQEKERLEKEKQELKTKWQAEINTINKMIDGLKDKTVLVDFLEGIDDIDKAIEDFKKELKDAQKNYVLKMDEKGEVTIALDTKQDKTEAIGSLQLDRLSELKAKADEMEEKGGQNNNEQKTDEAKKKEIEEIKAQLLALKKEYEKSGDGKMEIIGKMTELIEGKQDFEFTFTDTEGEQRGFEITGPDEFNIRF